MRRKYLIAPRFQLKYLTLVLGIIVLLTLVHAGILYPLVEQVRRSEQALLLLGRDNRDLVQNLEEMPEHEKTRVDAGYEAMRTQSEDAHATLTTLLWFDLFFTLLVSLVVAGFGLVLTQRIAGPIMLASRALHQALSGETIARRELRDKDEFRVFYQDLIHALERLEGERKA
ncbi:MAG: hypothetical protein A2284_13275 [Deltaproteobacteria bacterium RIFOXYA12_FULL_61_11]|nr:MAG: hypothetical protein A2284_13275 [Deltaproteobacteria bacterium RIFOXYA12_FULL_61_11]